MRIPARLTRVFIFLLILRKRVMSDTPDIQKYVGENIKKIRQARGLSLEEVAARIYKSKSTVSKYEKGTIAIDIATLKDIAIALDVHPAQLLMTSAPEKQLPKSRELLEDTYMFSYDGREKRIIKSVIERYQTDLSNRFSINLYYDVPSRDQLGECVVLYQGYSTRYDVLENYTLENSYHEIEQIWLSCISGLSQNRMQVGFLAGLLNATLLPAVRKVVLSPYVLSDEELMERLIFTKKDLQTIRKLNIFIIDEFIG